MQKVAAKNFQLRLSHFTIENFHEAVFWLDSKQNIFQVNDIACEMTGYSKEELMAMKIADLNRSSVLTDWAVFWERLKKEKKIIFEAQHRHKTGHFYDIEITSNFVEFEGKEFSCSIVRDIRKRKLEEEILRTVSEATSGFTGKDFFVQLAKNISVTLSMRYALITECANEEKTRLRTLCYLDGQLVLENIEYDTAGVPCEIIMQGKDFFMADGVEQYFPKEKGIQSYIGVPVFSPVTGEVIGHIIAVDPNPVASENNQTSILKIFASRAGAEIERIKVENKLKQKNVELKERLNEIELYHTSIENLRDQIFWLDKTGKFIRVNEAVCRESGFDKDELMNMHVFDLNPDLSKEEWKARWEETSKDKQQVLETFSYSQLIPEARWR